MKKTGYLLLQIAGYLIVLGGISDVIMPFFTTALPEAHLHFLNIQSTAVTNELINLDAALLRAIGGCLIGIGIGAITIIYSIVKSSKRALTGLLIMVTVAEGVNASQMLLIHSSYFFFPLACVIIMWIGGILWWIGSKSETKNTLNNKYV